MFGVIYRVLDEILSLIKDNREEEFHIIDIGDIGGNISIEFEDGHQVDIRTDNLVEEYIKLRLMWHSTSDMLELIPYLNQSFRYQMSIDD